MKHRPLIVISLDSLSASDFDALRDLPVLGKLLQRGSCIRNLRGIYPTQTYPLHATIITGTHPDIHGVASNTRFSPGNPSPEWHWFRRDIRVPTLYDTAREEGIRTAAFLWPVSGGAKIRYNLPEITPTRKGQNQTILVLTNGTPLFLLGIQRRFGHLLRGTERSALDDFVTASAAWLFRKKQPGLMLIHLLDLDHKRHDHGFSGKIIDRTLEEEDRRIGTLLESVREAGMEDETNIVIIGDHAQKDVRFMVRLNAAFEEAGLITRNAAGRIASWKVWANACDGSAHIYAKDREAVERAVVVARSIMQEGKPVVKQVFRKDQIARLRTGGEMDLILEAGEGFYFTADTDGPVVDDHPGHLATHGYLPDRYASMLLAAGPDIRPGQEIREAEIIDIAPTLARLLGISLPAAEGSALSGLLKQNRS